MRFRFRTWIDHVSSLLRSVSWSVHCFCWSMVMLWCVLYGMVCVVHYYGGHAFDITWNWATTFLFIYLLLLASLSLGGFSKCIENFPRIVYLYRCTMSMRLFMCVFVRVLWFRDEGVKKIFSIVHYIVALQRVHDAACDDDDDDGNLRTFERIHGLAWHDSTKSF